MLVDTNILVYAHDFSAGKKNRQSIEILDELRASRAGVLSTQVLMEFVRAVTGNIPNPMSMKSAASQARLFLATWPVVPITGFIVEEALQGVISHRLSLWDSQV
jgi:predicted nucleic acid-binding protein